MPAGTRFTSALVALAAGLGTASLLAQASPAASTGPTPSRVELYGGYGYFHPQGSDIGFFPYETISSGGVGSISGYFTRNFGVQVEGSAFPNGDKDNNCVYTAQGGPIARVQFGRFVPFVHALGGAAKVGGPRLQTCSVWGWGVTGGAGIDYILPYFHDRFSVRPVQGDFQYSRIDNGPLIIPPGTSGGLGEIYAYRLSAGFSFRFGSIGPAGGGTTLTCSAEPANVYPGDPVTLNSSVDNLRADRRTRYLWTTTGGRITGEQATASLDTAGLSAGTYNVTGVLGQGYNSRAVATCTTSFTIENPLPPSVSCAADRSAINSGDKVTITAKGFSPQNRPLTYSYSASNGQITGSGTTATLSTNGATPGAITVNCMVTDDKGRTASGRASVVIATPVPPAPIAQAKGLCSLSFERDHQRPDRVDNEGKACLDDIALTLNRDTGSRLALIGNHAQGETNRNSAARAMNAAEYLVKEKGIDAARLDLRIAAEPARSVTTMLVPPGATVDAAAGSAFDSSSVVRKGQAYGMPGVKTAPVRRSKARRHTSSTRHKTTRHKGTTKTGKAPISAFTTPS